MGPRIMFDWVATVALWLGYAVLAYLLTGVAFAFLCVCLSWWECNVLAKRLRFDGKGGIERIQKKDKES